MIAASSPNIGRFETDKQKRRNELISLLIGQLGVDEGQAKGGAGLLFKLAPMKEGGLAFQKIKDPVPDVDEMIAAYA